MGVIFDLTCPIMIDNKKCHGMAPGVDFTSEIFKKLLFCNNFLNNIHL